MESFDFSNQDAALMNASMVQIKGLPQDAEKLLFTGPNSCLWPEGHHDSHLLMGQVSKKPTPPQCNMIQCMLPPLIRFRGGDEK